MYLIKHINHNNKTVFSNETIFKYSLNFYDTTAALTKVRIKMVP